MFMFYLPYHLKFWLASFSILLDLFTFSYLLLTSSTICFCRPLHLFVSFTSSPVMLRFLLSRILMHFESHLWKWFYVVERLLYLFFPHRFASTVMFDGINYSSSFIGGSLYLNLLFFTLVEIPGNFCALWVQSRYLFLNLTIRGISLKKLREGIRGESIGPLPSTFNTIHPID